MRQDFDLVADDELRQIGLHRLVEVLIVVGVIVEVLAVADVVIGESTGPALTRVPHERLQVNEPLEGILADARDIHGDGEGRQSGATAEGFSPDGGQRFREVQSGEVTTHKGVSPDAGDAIGHSAVGHAGRNGQIAADVLAPGHHDGVSAGDEVIEAAALKVVARVIGFLALDVLKQLPPVGILVAVHRRCGHVQQSIDIGLGREAVVGRHVGRIQAAGAHRRQPGAAVKGVVLDAGDRAGQLQRRQRGVPEGIAADGGDTIGDVDTRQAGTAREGLVADRRQLRRQGHRRQAGTVLEGALQRGHALGNRQARQSGTSLEGAVQALDAVMQGHTGQAATIIEHVPIQRSHRLGDRDTGQACAIGESRFPDAVDR